jgi:hypothetical protein
MKKHSMVKRLVASLSILALASFLWGCGENSITGVDEREVPLETSQNDDTPVDDGTDKWW